jgi:Fic family protein
MELNELIKKIDALKAELDKLKPIKPDFQKKLDEKIRLEFSYNSNHIEGNTLTYGETELLLIRGKTRGNHDAREYEEMKGHDLAFTMIKDWAADAEHPLTENMIKELNQIILKEPFWKEAITPDGQPTRRLIKIGDYKEYPNSVRLQNGEIFEYASPTDTPIKMGELIEWYRKEEGNKELHPIAFAALLHYNFVRIHPFDDGNGRVSRLLMNYVLLKNDLPPVIIKSADKTNYLAALNNADTGDMDSFVGYVANELVWSLELIIKGAQTGNFEEPSDLDKKISLLKTELSRSGDDDAQVDFTEQVFLKIYDTWISKLISKFVVEVKKFNGLFVKPSHHITIGAHMEWGVKTVALEKFTNGQEKLIAERIRTKLVYSELRYKGAEIEMVASYEILKKGALKNNFKANFGIEVIFNHMKYDIFISSNFTNARIAPKTRYMEPRLIHVSLKEEEIDELCKKLSTNIYEYIDKYTKENGIR